MNPWRAMTAALAAAIVLAGCTTAPSVPQSSLPPPAVPTSDATPANFGEQKLVAKRVGETGYLVSDVDGHHLMDVAITSVEEGAACETHFSAPEADRRVAVAFEISLSDDFAKETGVGLLSLADARFLVFTAAGSRALTDQTSAQRCGGADARLPDLLGPGERASAAVVVDLSADDAYVAFTLLELNGGGWAWRID